MHRAIAMSPDGFPAPPARPNVPPLGPQPVSPGDSGSPIITRKPPNDAPTGDQPAPSKIRAFAQALAGGHSSDDWARKPHANRTGAMHVKSFHCKLTGEALDFMDKQINDWLDAHPDYEVKMVSGAIGEWMGKTKEPNLIVQVWV